MADLLYEKRIREERASVGREIQTIADRVIRENRDMHDDEYKTWCRLNPIWDTLNVQVRAFDAAHGQRSGAMPGRGNFDGGGELRSQGFSVPFAFGEHRGQASPVDMAIAAWLKTQTGVPIDEDLYQSCRSLGISPHSSAFDVGLQPTRPKLGSEWFGRHDSRGVETRALNTVSAAAGAVTTDTGFIARLEKAMLAQSGMLQSAEVMVTQNGNDLPWPTSDDTSNEGELLGENTAVGEQDIVFGARIFRAYKLSSKLVRVSSELLQDSALDLAGEVGQILGERLGRTANRLWTVGTGASQPWGIVPTSTLGVTTASATAITADELLDLIHSVGESYRNGGALMMADSTFKALRKLKNGDGDYIFAAATQGAPATLWGYPVVINNHMATIAASAKVIVFGQLSKYKIRLAGQVRMRRLVERYADQDQDGFIAFQRIDGNLLDAGQNPVKHLAMHA